MSDTNVIPGSTSNVNSAKMIDALMKVKRVRLDAMTKEVEKTKESRDVWQELGVKINKLRDASRDLYNYNNPFSEKIAESSNERILTATATREAFELSKSIRVEQVASADRFISRSLDKNFKVEAGVYGFKVGSKETSIRYNGGSLSDFAQAITKNGNSLVKAQVVNDTKSSQVLIIESQLTGSKNRLELTGKSLDLALAAGMLERAQVTAKTVDLATSPPVQWERKLDTDVYKIAGNKLSLSPGAELKIPVQPALALNKDMVIEFSVTVTDIKEAPPVQKGTGPEQPFVGDINFKGVRIENERSIPPTSTLVEPVKEKVEDMRVLFAGSGKNVVPLPEIDPKAKSQTYRAPLGELLDSVDALYLRNRNTNKSIDIDNIKIFDQKAYGDYKPVNPLSTSNDAVIYMDGIRIVRETNEIADLLPGVTVSLKEPSPDPVTLKVKRDTEAIKEAIVGFVGNYNQLMGQIHIVTRSSDDIVNALQYLTPEEKTAAKKQMAMLKGDITLMQLERKLQIVMMDPYRTEGGSALTLLAQMGVSTNSSKPGTAGSIDKMKLLGYIEIEDKKLDEMITNHADWVKELFGRDRDNDKVVDEGLGVSLDNTLKPYTQIGGLLTTKADTYKKQLDQKGREIEEYNDYLADYEAGLRKKFGSMEGMLNTLEQSSKAIDNFEKQNSAGK